MTAAESTTGCFLCEKPREQADERNLLLYRGARVYAALNLYPYNTGHVLIAPYAHGGDLVALDPETGAALMALTQTVVAALRDEYRPDAFNVGMNLGRPAGAGMPDHLHVHVVPRYAEEPGLRLLVNPAPTSDSELDSVHGQLTERR